jgi:uncharacterized protein
VNSSRYPLRINVGFLLNAAIGTSRDFHFDFPSLRISQDLDVLNFNGLARIGRVPQGMLTQCDFHADVKAECVRCLVEFQQPIHAIFNELYAFKSKAVTESGLILPEDGTIDLATLLREFFLLEIPISPLCRTDCKGLCVICGEDLNIRQCEHVQSKNAPIDAL